jgi:processive 1,2-diacylglycerol beta-glucosyltransferase
MVLLEPLPGQEERNATNLVGHGAAILQNDPSAAGLAAAELIRNPDALAKMRGATRHVGCAQSAANAAKAVLELLGVAANHQSTGTHAASQEAAA